MLCWRGGETRSIGLQGCCERERCQYQEVMKDRKLREFMVTIEEEEEEEAEEEEKGGNYLV